MPNAVPADHPTVARRSLNFKVVIAKSAANTLTHQVADPNSSATSPGVAADAAMLDEDEGNAANETSIASNLDRLFSSFQAELADVTGSASGLWYVRSRNMSGDMSPSGHSTDAMASGGLSYAQCVSLASVLGLASAVLAQASQTSKHAVNKSRSLRWPLLLRRCGSGRS